MTKRDYYGALCAYAEINDEDGIKDVLRKMDSNLTSVKKVTIGKNKDIMVLNGQKFSLYDGATGKWESSISPTTSDYFDALCEAFLKNSSIAYSFDFS